MKNATRMLVLLLLFAGAGCQDQRSAGTSTETENAIVARSFPVDSILPTLLGKDDDPVVATLRLDSSNFNFSSSRVDGKDLDVVTDDDKALAFDLVSWDPTAALGRLRVRLEPHYREQSSIIKVRTGLPAANRSSDSAVWKDVPSHLRLAWSSVLLDDFESGNLLHNGFPDSSFWFLGGSITGSGIVAASNGRSGSVLHLTCNLNQCTTDKGLLAATSLTNTYHSFRALDSIELWTRGTGRLWVTLESLDSLQMARLARGRIDSVQPRRAWTSRPLDTQWNRVAIRPSDFDPADGQEGNVGWLAMRDSINYFTILLDSGTEMWIDDIRFHGILAEDLR